MYRVWENCNWLKGVAPCSLISSSAFLGGGGRNEDQTVHLSLPVRSRKRGHGFSLDAVDSRHGGAGFVVADVAAPEGFGKLLLPRGGFRPGAVFVRLLAASNAGDDVADADASAGKASLALGALTVHGGFLLHVGASGARSLGAKIRKADGEALRAAAVSQEPAAAAMNCPAAASAAEVKWAIIVRSILAAADEALRQTADIPIGRSQVRLH